MNRFFFISPCLFALLTVSSITAAKYVEINDKISIDLDSVDILKNPKRIAYKTMVYDEVIDNENFYTLSSVVNCVNQTSYYVQMTQYDLYGKFLKNMDISKFPSKLNPSDIDKKSVQRYVYNKYCK